MSVLNRLFARPSVAQASGSARAFVPEIARPESPEADRRFGVSESLATKLSLKWDDEDSPLKLDGAKLVLLGFNAANQARITKMLRAAGAAETSGFDIDALAQASFGAPGAAPSLIVNLEGFDTLENAVSALMVFRKAHPEVVIVLVSTAVAADDLSPERRMICDATLAAPLSFQRLVEGLLAAARNNRQLRS